MNHMMRWKPRRGIDSSPRHTYLMTVESRWRTLTALGLALVVLGGTVLGIGSARADTNASGHGPGQLVSWSAYSGFWLGAYQTSNGLAICVTPSGDSPVGQGGSDPYTIAPGWVDDQGEAASAEQLAQVAYVLWQMGAQPTDYEAGMARLAVFTLLGYDSVHVYGSKRLYNFDVFSDGSDGQEIANQLGMLSDVQGLVSGARARANTWDGSQPQIVASDKVDVPGETITASVTFPGLPAGYDVRFTVTKPDGSTENVMASTDAKGTARLSYVTAPNVQGAYSVGYDIGDVPPSAPVAYAPGGSNPQDMFFAAPSTRSAQGAVLKVVVRYVPEVGTSVSAARVTAGDVLTDTVTSNNLDPSLSWSLTGALYGPVPAVDGTCEDLDWSHAPVALKFTRDIDPSEIGRGGTSVVSGLGPWSVGLTHDDVCVSYGEHLMGRDSSGEVVREADHLVGSPGQTALVEKVVSEISSTVSATQSKPGDVVTDSVRVTNVVLAAAGVTYEWAYQGSLYGPLAPGGSWEDAPVVTTWTRAITDADVADDGTAVLSGLGGFTIPMNQEAGCYSYSASVDAVGSDGSTYHLSHPVGDPAQTTCVSPSWITIGTQVSSQSANPSETISDHFSAAGLVAAMGDDPVSWTVRVDVSTADVDAAGQCGEVDWTGAEVVHHEDLAIDPAWIDDGSVELAGVGAYTIPEEDPAHCLTYSETLLGVWNGGEVSVVHPPGQESQTTLVASGVIPVAPTISVTTGGTVMASHTGLTQASLRKVLLVLGAVGRCLMG